jgi:colanic acid biosynthesis glycosyl transferase WcaI
VAATDLDRSIDLRSPTDVRFPAAGRSVVVVSPTFHPEPLGTPLYAADMVTWLDDAGWDVHVVTAQPYYPQFELYDGYGRSKRQDWLRGVPVHRLPTIVPKGGRVRWRLASDANFLAQGVARARVGRVPRAATVLSVSPGSPVAPLVGAAVRRRGGRHICIVHDVQSGLAAGLGMVRSTRLTDAMRAVERRSLGAADLLLTLSEEMAGVLRSMGVQTPIRVLPLWSTVAAPDAVIGPVTDVQFSGNFGRKQGLDQLVALVVGLQRRRPHTTFTIRGAGPMRSMLQGALDHAGTGVIVEPPVDTDALPAALASSRVHVVPQLAATTTHVVPSKIVNALAVGGAILAFSGDGSPIAGMAARCDAIRVVAPGDVEAAVAATCDLLDGQDVRQLRAAAITYATEHHHRERLLRRLHDALIATPPDQWPAST